MCWSEEQQRRHVHGTGKPDSCNGALNVAVPSKILVVYSRLFILERQAETKL